MKTRKTYEVIARRSGGWWALEVTGVPRAVSQARRLDQADEMIRDALSMVLDVPEDSFDVVLNPILDKRLASLVKSANSLRQQAAEARDASTGAVEQVVKHAKLSGLPVRDTAVLLGLSHQYISKKGQKAS
jgi:hypothetical protein